MTMISIDLQVNDMTQLLIANCGTVLWMQNLVSVIVVSGLSFFGLITTEPLTWKLIKVWLPVNVIFVGMLVTSMFRYGILSLSPSLSRQADFQFRVS